MTVTSVKQLSHKRFHQVRLLKRTLSLTTVIDSYPPGLIHTNEYQILQTALQSTVTSSDKRVVAGSNPSKAA